MPPVRQKRVQFISIFPTQKYLMLFSECQRQTASCSSEPISACSSTRRANGADYYVFYGFIFTMYCCYVFLSLAFDTASQLIDDTSCFALFLVLSRP